MNELIMQVKNQLTEAFNATIHRILTRMSFLEDMIMYCKFSVYLSSLQEDVGDFRNAVQTLRSALWKVIECRKELL